MYTSTNHDPKRQTSLSRYFASGDKIDKTANCLAGHGWASLENNKCRRSTGG